MCNYNTLKNNRHGYVVQCKSCDHIQVAFGTTVMSFTRPQFYEHMSLLEEQYKIHGLYAAEDRKTIHIPTAAKGVAMIYTLNELRTLLGLLREGRSKLEYNDLFVINEN